MTRARVLRARNRASLAGGFDRDHPARRGRRGRCRAQLARHRTRHGRCTGERRAVPGLAPSRRRSQRLADPRDCADPHDIADPENVANPTQSASAPVGNPGIAITARPDPDGSFFVSEVITSPEAVTEVAVRPASIRDAGIGFERLRPTAINVELTAGGQALVVPDGPITSEVTLRWGSPTQQVQLRYRLSGVSVASAHAKPGRALAAFGSLLDRMPANLPVTVVVTGKTVLSLTCPQLPLATPACGAGKAPQFRTLHPIPFDRSRVLGMMTGRSGR